MNKVQDYKVQEVTPELNEGAKPKDDYCSGEVVALWFDYYGNLTCAPLATSELYTKAAGRYGAPQGHGRIMHVGDENLIVCCYMYPDKPDKTEKL